MTDAATGAQAPSTQGSGQGIAVAAPAGRTPPADPAPLKGHELAVAGFVLALANFMTVLDLTIANVSVPYIAGGLAVSPTEGTWVITSYAVAEAITVPLTGWLAQRFGTVRTFFVSMIMFGVCSALCGIAPSLGVLILFRVLQGVSGGPLIPLSQTLLLRVFPREKAPQAMGLWATTTVVAPILGPILGGLICDTWNWPWIFYINVPFVISCLWFGWRLIAPHETPIVKRPIDFVGLSLLVVWVGAMQIMLDKGEELDWFGSRFIVGCLITAVIGFFAFLIWETTEPDPVVNLKVFRSRGFATAAAVMCVAYGGFFAAVVLVPLWLQTNLSYTATWAGFAIAPQGVSAVMMAPVVARLTRRFDPRLLISAGVMWFAVVMVWRAGFESEVDFFHVAIPQFALGFALPFFFVPIMQLALGSLPPEQTASGAGLINFMRTTAAAFAVSLCTTAWNDKARAGRNEILNLMNSQEGLRRVADAGFQPEQALRRLEQLVQGQGVMLATDQVFMTLAAVLALASLTVWLAPRPRRVAGGGH